MSRHESVGTAVVAPLEDDGTTRSPRGLGTQYFVSLRCPSKGPFACPEHVAQGVWRSHGL